jgi:hypothetical protein
MEDLLGELERCKYDAVFRAYLALLSNPYYAYEEFTNAQLFSRAEKAVEDTITQIRSRLEAERG